MDMAWIATLITAMVGLFGLFFGRRYWRTLETLIQDQGKRITKLDERIEELRKEKRDLHKRFDQLERDYYALKAENERLRLKVA